MIDHTSERLMTLSEAARTLPGRRRGRPLHASSIYRWATVGVGSGGSGERLETIQVGGTTYTTASALADLFARLSKQKATPQLNRRHMDFAVENELDELGVKDASSATQKP